MTRAANLRRSFPSVRFIVTPFRWVGKRRWRLCCAALVLLAIGAGPPLWWATQLWGLPDIGDPFDVAAFRTMAIPDDRNAFVVYRQAAGSFKPLRLAENAVGGRINYFACWSEVETEFRRWLDENREPLALCRRGTDLPAALDPSALSGREHSRITEALRSFESLALLEALRLEEQGDMAGAWNWYRAALRMVHQVGVYGTASRRYSAWDWHRNLRRQLTTWSGDQRTTRALLRQALDDVVACETLVPSESYTLKAEYLNLDVYLSDPNNAGRQVPPSWMSFLKSADYQLSPEMWQRLYDGWRFWQRDPERSRRVIRLAVANWLAYWELPTQERPSPDPNVFSHDFYSFGPGASANACVLSPDALERWLDTTFDAQEILKTFNGRSLRIKEHADHRAVVILLGRQLYRRDHAADPPEPEALVGPYLKRLPAEFPDDAKDKTSGAGGTE